MITISLFALLALSLTLLVWVALLLRRQSLLKELNEILLERANLQEAGIVNISKDLIGLQEELMRVTDSRNEAKEELLRTKENSYAYVQSLQEEIEDLAEDLDVAQDCIWDKERQLTELAEANQLVADTLLSLSYKEGPVTPRELTQLREIALRWDQIPF